MITQTVNKMPFLAMLIVILSLVAACGSQTIAPAADGNQSKTIVKAQSVGEQAATVALDQVGIPYRYGGSTTSGFDCSGLVQFSYLQAGKKIPRTTTQLWSSTATVERDDLQVGDLLFFSIEGKMSHVGMYVGKQQCVHAPSSGRSVTVTKLTSPFYASAFIRAGRPR
jgi:cell wall-associated NlpC family hydrolase